MSEGIQALRPLAVQRGYSIGLVVRCALIAAVVFTAFSIVMVLALDVGLARGYGAISAAVDLATKRLAILIIPAGLACAVVAGAGCAWVAIRASHRVAGPVYRLSKDLSRMADGDYDFVVATRQGDQLKDLSEGLERARVELQGRLRRLKQCTSNLAKAAAADEPSADELKRHLAALEDVLARMAAEQKGSL